MRVRAVRSSIIASVSVLVVGWQMGAASAVTPTGAESLPTSSTSNSTSSAGSSASGDSSGTAAGSTGTEAGAPSASATATPTPTPTDPVAVAAAPATTPTADTAALKNGSFTGTVAQARSGTVQVQLVVSLGKIADVVAHKLTDNERNSIQISHRAAPLLRTEVLANQSAQVDSVGGATYTSDAYLTSLQSPLGLAKA